MARGDINKAAIVSALLAKIQEELDLMTEQAQATAAGATHEESRAENDKDTRGLEASYLARGQAQRAKELEADFRRVQYMPLETFDDASKIATSALVTLMSDADEEMLVFLAPAGGGTCVAMGGKDVRVVTPQSPLGQLLVGQTIDDTVDLKRRGQTRTYDIVGIL